jgi:hypothetical protein
MAHWAKARQIPQQTVSFERDMRKLAEVPPCSGAKYVQFMLAEGQIKINLIGTTLKRLCLKTKATQYRLYPRVGGPHHCNVVIPRT